MRVLLAPKSLPSLLLRLLLRWRLTRRALRILLRRDVPPLTLQ